MGICKRVILMLGMESEMGKKKVRTWIEGVSNDKNGRVNVLKVPVQSNNLGLTINLRCSAALFSLSYKRCHPLPISEATIRTNTLFLHLTQPLPPRGIHSITKQSSFYILRFHICIIQKTHRLSLPCKSHCRPIPFYRLHYFQDDLVTGKLCHGFQQILLREHKGLHNLAFAYCFITTFPLPVSSPHTHSLLQPRLQFP